MGNRLMTRDEVNQWAQEVADAFNALPLEEKEIAAKMLEGMSQKLFQGEVVVEEA